jgi:hypothetical protein
MFLDETWANVNSSELSLKKRRPATGTRYIILRSGTLNGLVSGTSFFSGTESGDYLNSVNGENFEYWMLTYLLPNLKEPSVVMDGTVCQCPCGEVSNTHLEKG